MISLENISKSFGGQVLFQETGFRLNSGERVGLVGRNGHGKTTLIRMIVGEESADEGQIVIPKSYRMGYVRQHIEFKEDTVLKEGMRGLPEPERDHHWKVEKVLAGLGFSNEDMNRSPLEFSGGFQVRLNLAKVLVSEPDLLLLDEPTNYLDITAIRWVRNFLAAWPRELILITHDRGFMDQTVTHTVAIHRRKFRKIPGDTGKLYAQIAQDEEVYEKTRINDERKEKEIEQFITRFRAKARLAGMVQSRVKTLQKMEKREKLERIKGLDFSFQNRPFKGKQLMLAENLAFSYDMKTPLIKDLSFSVAPGDRICVVGKNGRGKTTLIKILAGLLEPQKGILSQAPTLDMGVYEQTNVKTLVDERTVVDEVMYAEKGVDLQRARNICGLMMFEGDSALKKIAVLSGGEKSRVMLGKLLARPVNLLLLDEPTNHLDMESCDALLIALDNFDGAVIMVTHNEMFLHTLANRLIVFKDGHVSMFEGSYGYFLEKGGWGDAQTSQVSKTSEVSLAQMSEVSKTPEASSAPKLNKKEMRRRRSEIIAEKGRVLKPLSEGITRAENGIDAREKELERLNQEMQSASQGRNGQKIKEISRALHACQTAIDQGFKDLEDLTRQLEEQQSLFDKKLALLEAEGEESFDERTSSDPR
jgi:ATP-binding cassette subfamily F protein 3